MGEWHDYLGIICNETPVEIRKTKERLNVFNLPWHRPILDGLNFGRIHGEAVFREDEPQIVDSVLVEFSFFRFTEETV